MLCAPFPITLNTFNQHFEVYEKCFFCNFSECFDNLFWHSLSPWAKLYSFDVSFIQKIKWSRSRFYKIITISFYTCLLLLLEYNKFRRFNYRLVSKQNKYA